MKTTSTFPYAWGSTDLSRYVLISQILWECIRRRGTEVFDLIDRAQRSPSGFVANKIDVALVGFR